MKTNKRLVTSTFSKNIIKQFVTVILLDKNNARDTNYFTKNFTNC